MVVSSEVRWDALLVTVPPRALSRRTVRMVMGASSTSDSVEYSSSRSSIATVPEVLIISDGEREGNIYPGRMTPLMGLEYLLESGR